MQAAKRIRTVQNDLADQEISTIQNGKADGGIRTAQDDRASQGLLSVRLRPEADSKNTVAEKPKGRKSSGGHASGTHLDSRAVGALLAAAGGVCWGLSGSMGQYLFQYQGMDSRWLVPYRLGIAGILMFVYCLFRHREKLFGVFHTAWGARQIFVYATGVCLGQYLYFQTIQWSSAAAGTILQDLSPVFVLMCSCVSMKRWPKLREIAAIFLALAGVFLITTHGRLDAAPVSPRAVLTGVGCALMITLYNEVPKAFLDQYPVIVLQSWAFLLGGVVSFLVFHPWTYHYVPSPVGIAGIAFVVVVGNIIAFTIYMTGVALIGPGKAILYGFAEPVTAAIVTFTVFHGTFTVFDALGFSAVFAMLVLISLREKKAE